jgi:ABC-type sugar transport system permease subunit
MKKMSGLPSTDSTPATAFQKPIVVKLRSPLYSARVSGCLFVLPVTALLIFWSILPILLVFFLSFTDFKLTTLHASWVGIQNYLEFFIDSRFWTALSNTTYYALGTVPITFAVALAFALLLNQKVRFTGLFRILSFMPLVTSTVVVAFLWRIIFSAAGPINSLLGFVGIPPQLFLESPYQAMPSVILTSSWQGVAFTTVLFLAALQTIPAELIDAAKVDGADRWQCFIFITLPLLRGVSLFIIIMSTIGAFRVFTEIYIMTQGGPSLATTTLVYFVYREAFHNLRLGSASAVSIFIFILIMVLTLIQLRFRRTIEW